MTTVEEIISKIPWNRNAMADGVKNNECDGYSSIWKRHIEKVRMEAPYVIVEDEGETIRLGEISKGCQACKSGFWDCIFVTMQCNLSCPFCCSSENKHQNIPMSAFGEKLEETLTNYRLIKPGGISFSGGEPLLEFPKLLRMIMSVRKEMPEAYVWVYTNGVLADREKITSFRDLGIDEIRFNLAASGYDDPVVMRNVEFACKILPNVTVECPMVPDHEGKLKKSMKTWESLGVRYLNLHELMYEPGTPSFSLNGKRMKIVTPDGHITFVHPDSRASILGIMEYIHDSGIRISVNECSIQNKLRQVRGRRKLLGRLIEKLPGASEVLSQDDCLETLCGISPEGEIRYFSPMEFSRIITDFPSYQFLRLWRIPPLTIRSEIRWDGFEMIKS